MRTHVTPESLSYSAVDKPRGNQRIQVPKKSSGVQKYIHKQLISSIQSFPFELSSNMIMLKILDRHCFYTTEARPHREK